MTDLDMDALTRRQREVFGAIACGQDGGHAPSTLHVLARKGLIVGRYETLPGTPPVKVIRWEVPVGVHIQWAEWCATQPDAKEA